ncbi:MAG: MerR family transcriptional regulator [Ktedonobacteraceae bacterium]|nr:MerR family transcriptional regulator [Ktedonobacteraceae bacterium]
MIATDQEQGASSQADESRLLTIEQVATRTGLTKRTLRYYEEVGLLRPTGRTEGNYRRYSEADIQGLEHIKGLRDLLGFSLSEIRALLEVEEERGQIREAYRQATDAADKIAQLNRSDELTHRQLKLIEHKMAGLEQMRATLLAKLERHVHTRERLLNEDA